jgi:uncharacterized protein with von Willebrand factor type A (vWA) domain
MRTIVLNFINELRQAGLRISLSESMDALQAIAVAGIEREILQEALAASLVKEEADRPAFDEIFTRFFMGPGRRRKGKLDQQTGAGEGQRTKEQGSQPQTRAQPAKKQQPNAPVSQERPEDKEQSTLQKHQQAGEARKDHYEQHAPEGEEDERQQQHKTTLARHQAW